jgi:hypothetical protein
MRGAITGLLLAAGTLQGQDARWTTVTDTTAAMQVALDYQGIRHAPWLSADHGTLFVWVRVSLLAGSSDSTGDRRTPIARLAVKCGDSEIAYGQEDRGGVIVPLGRGAVVASETRLLFEPPAPDSWEETAMRAACARRDSSRVSPAPAPRPF